MSNNFTSHFSADDAALVLIDFQPQMFMGVESHDRNAIKNNLQITAKGAKLFDVPTLLLDQAEQLLTEDLNEDGIVIGEAEVSDVPFRIRC